MSSPPHGGPSAAEENANTPWARDDANAIAATRNDDGASVGVEEGDRTCVLLQGDGGGTHTHTVSVKPSSKVEGRIIVTNNFSTKVKSTSIKVSQMS